MLKLNVALSLETNFSDILDRPQSFGQRFVSKKKPNLIKLMKKRLEAYWYFRLQQWLQIKN